MISLLGLDPRTYTPSALHQADRIFRETNCYVDIWIELLHSLGINPASAMAFACSIDFEDDQWTFFKPPVEDLDRLYGIDVHEMQLYRPTVDHVAEQLIARRAVIMEADSYYMPDRDATTYRRTHVKSSIAIEAIDPAAERLRYFHGPGYYELSGDDYRGLFRLGSRLSEDVLPPYVEVVRFGKGPQREDRDLRPVAREILRMRLSRGPKRNPWLAFGERLSRDLPELFVGDEASYHAYAFATVRQCGSAFESTISFVEWLMEPEPPAARAAEALARQVAGAKLLLLKLARRRPFDPAPIIDNLAADWETAMAALSRLAFDVRSAAS